MAAGAGANTDFVGRRKNSQQGPRQCWKLANVSAICNLEGGGGEPGLASLFEKRFFSHFYALQRLGGRLRQQ